jgi:hypothetical protein
MDRIQNCNDIARATAHTYGVIVVLVTKETSKISIGVGIIVDGCCRLDDHSLVLGSNKAAANSFYRDFVLMLRVEHDMSHLTNTVR